MACLALPCLGQELQPRRWSHLPIDTNFAGIGYVFTNADIAFDPVLLIDDARLELHSIPSKYIRTFEFLGKSARVDLLQAYQHAQWSGSLDGVLTRVTRSGWSDMAVRFALNVIGAPPLSAAEFAEYQAATESETIVGLGLVVQMPTGEYFEDKLLNLGTNRFTIRPQLGVVHDMGKLATEVSLASWIYTDNDEFFNGNYREQDPLYTVQWHVDYTFRPGLWASAGIGYGLGGKSKVNGIRKDDPRDSLVWGASFGYPISRNVGVKLTYLSQRTQTLTGTDADSLAGALSVLW